MNSSLYDDWVTKPHEGYILDQISLSCYRPLSQEDDISCLLDLLTHVKTFFLTLHCQFRYRYTKNNRVCYKSCEFPIMLGSQLSSAIDQALHDRRPDDVLNYARLVPLLRRPRPCLDTVLSDLPGTFVINGIVKYMPINLYFRNKCVHTVRQDTSVYYLYQSNRATSAKSKKSLKITCHRRLGGQFLINSVPTDERTVIETIRPYLTLGSDDTFLFTSPYPEAFTHWMKHCSHTSLDDLRGKLFYTPGHVLYLLRQFVLDRNNAHSLFRRCIASGELHFLLSKTAKFLPYLANQTVSETTDNVHSCFKELMMYNPAYTRTVSNTVQKISSGFSCSDKNRRLIDDSEKGFLCCLSSVDSHKVGIVVDLAQGTTISGPATGYCNWPFVIKKIVNLVNECMSEKNVQMLEDKNNNNNHHHNNYNNNNNKNNDNNNCNNNNNNQILEKNDQVPEENNLLERKTDQLLEENDQILDRRLYIYLNHVPIHCVETDDPKRDILFIYSRIRRPVKRLFGQVEIRHDGYVGLFFNCYEGIVYRDDSVSPAEYRDFLQEDENHQPATIYGENVKHLPYLRFNPPAKCVFVLHCLKSMIQSLRRDLGHFNFTNYTFLNECRDTTPSGLNGAYLRTIYLPLGEMTAEDGIVLSRSAADRWFSYTNWEQIRILVRTPGSARVREEIEIGNYLSVDSVILTLTQIDKIRMTRKSYMTRNGDEYVFRSSTRGKIVHVQNVHRRNELYFVAVVETVRRLRVGSKLSTIHGQKSVVSAILDDEDMPKIIATEENVAATRENAAATGENVAANGMPLIECVASAECFASRFTLGQIHEGLDIDGKDVTLEGYRHPVFCGRTFYTLLNHFPEDKLYSNKNKITCSQLTGAPVKGSQRHGGIRISLAELAAFTTYGVTNILHQKFIAESDGACMFLCQKDGCLHGSLSASRVRGHHALRSGKFGLFSKSCQRGCQDYAVCGFDLSVRTTHVKF